MPGLCFLESSTGENRSCHTRIKHGVTARLEPRAEQRDVSRAADAVSAFNHYQLAAVFFLFDAW
jgi:hypothetical protein